MNPDLPRILFRNKRPRGLRRRSAFRNAETRLPSLYEEKSDGTPGVTALISLLACMLTCGCSSFHRHWKQTVQHPAPTDTMEGAWEGQWFSDHNGHHGRLRCLVTHRSNDLHQAWFHAKYKKGILTLSFAYKVNLQVQRSNGTNGFPFLGQEDLGVLAGGLYHYEGHSTPDKFFSTYRSPYDYGTFQMSRPNSTAP